MTPIAQTTQAVSDMTYWTPAAVVTVATIIIGLIATKLIPAVASLIDKVKELQSGLADARADVGEVRGNVQGVQQSITRVTERMNTAQATVVDVAKNMAPPAPVASTEQRKVAQSALQQIADGQRVLAEGQAATVELLRQLANNTKPRPKGPK